MYRKWDKSRAPGGLFVLNKDCAQAQGLVGWYPNSGIIGGTRVEDRAGSRPLLTVNTPTDVRGELGAPGMRLNGTSQYAYDNTLAPIVTSAPLTLGAWFNSSSATTSQSLVAITRDLGSGNVNYFILAAQGTVAGDPIRAEAYNTSGGAQADTTAGYTIGTVQHGLAVFTSSTDRAAYLMGGSKGVSAVSKSPTTLTSISIGAYRGFGAAVSNWLAGHLYEACVWNVAKTDAEALVIGDIGRRFELWYPLRSPKWFSAGSGSSSTITAAAGVAAAATLAGTSTATTAITAAAGAATAATLASTSTAVTAITTAAGAATAATIAATSTAVTAVTSAAGVATVGTLVSTSTAVAAITPAAGVATTSTLVPVSDGSTITAAAGVATTSTLAGTSVAAASITAAAGTATAATLSTGNIVVAAIVAASGVATSATLVASAVVVSTITAASGAATVSTVTAAAVAAAIIVAAAGVATTAALLPVGAVVLAAFITIIAAESRTLVASLAETRAVTVAAEDRTFIVPDMQP